MTRRTPPTAVVAVALAVTLAGCTSRHRVPGPVTESSAASTATASTAAAPTAAASPAPTRSARPPAQGPDDAAVAQLERALAELERTLDQLDEQFAGDTRGR